MRAILIFAFSALFAVVALPFRFAVSVFANCVGFPRPARDHAALMPRAPRSIFDTRRMRLA